MLIFSFHIGSIRHDACNSVMVNSLTHHIRDHCLIVLVYPFVISLTWQINSLSLPPSETSRISTEPAYQRAAGREPGTPAVACQSRGTRHLSRAEP